MKKQFVVGICKYGLGFGLLAYVIWKNWSPPGSVGIAQAIQKPLQFGPLVIATVLLLGSVLLTFVRWFILVRAQGLPFTLGSAIRLGLMGYALSTFLPGSIGGDVFKAYYIAKEQSRRTVAVATVLIDRAVGLWALFWLVTVLGGGFWLLGDPAIHEHPSLQFAVGVAAAVVSASVLTWLLLGVLPQWRADRFAGRLRKIPKVGNAASEFWRAVWMYRCRGSSIALALLLSLVGHFGFVLTYYFAAQVFLEPGLSNQIPTHAENFVIIPIGMTWQALFPTPGGVGGGEFGFGALYATIGKPETNGVMASLVYRILSWALAFVGYLVYLRMRPTLPPISEEATDQSGKELSWQPANGEKAEGVSSVSTEA